MNDQTIKGAEAVASSSAVTAEELGSADTPVDMAIAMDAGATACSELVGNPELTAEDIAELSTT